MCSGSAQRVQTGGQTAPTTTIVVRDARHEDAKTSARLIFSTGPDLLRLLFYRDDARTLALVEELFSAPRNDFTFEASRLAEWDGTVAGLITYTAPADARSFQRETGRRLIAEMGVLPVTVRMPLYALLGLAMGKRSADALYVHYLATDPRFRRRGIAGMLLDDAFAAARAAGLPAVELHVDPENAAARRVYERRGLCVVHRTSFLSRLGIRALDALLMRVELAEATPQA